MNEHDQLREQMWDLVYGLTTPEETAALHARIKSDRAVARTYAEVRLEADLVAEAAKVEDPSVMLPTVAAKSDRVSAGRAKESAQTAAGSGAGSGWSLHWLGAIGASALAVLMAVGIFWRQEQPASENTYLVSVDLYSDTPLVRGLDQELEVRAKDVADGKPAKVDLKAQIARADGTTVYERWLETDDQGRSRLHVPADYLESGNKVIMYRAEAPLPGQQVAQQSDGVAPPQPSAPEDQVRKLERSVETKLARKPEPLVAATLDVRDDPLKAQLSFNQDWYQPGEMVEFRAHISSAFTQRPPDVQSLELRLVGPDGKPLSPEETQPHPQAGVVTGKFRLPPEAQPGHYALTIQSSPRGEPQANAIVQVGGEIAQLDSVARFAKALSEPAATDVKQQVGSKLNRGLAMTPAPAAIPPREEPGRSASADKAGAAGAPKKSGEGSRGGYANSPQAFRAPQPPAPAPAGNAPAPLSKADADGSRPEPALAAGNIADSRIESFAPTMDDMQQVAEAKKLKETEPTTLALVPPPQLAGKPLLIEARQSHVVISRLEVRQEADKKEERLGEEAESEKLGRQLSLALPPRVTGPVDVFYFDNSASPPKPLWATRYDIPARNEFDVAMANANTTYAPGQTVRLKVQVRDQGQAAANVAFGYKVAPLLAMTTGDELAAAEREGTNEFFEKRKLEAAGAIAPDAKEGAKGSQDRRRTAQLGDARSKGAQAATVESAPTPAPAPGAAGALPPSAAGALGPVAASGAATKSALSEAPKESAAEFGMQSTLGVPTDESALLPDYSLAAEQPALPMLLASNEDDVRRALDERQTVEAERAAQFALWRHWLAKGLLLGGVVLLVVLGVGVYLQRPSQARAWVPSLAIAAASFVVGMVWLIQQPRHHAQTIAKLDSTVADHDEARTMSVAKESGATAPEALSAQSDAPAAGDTAAQFSGGLGGAGPGGFGGGIGRDMPPPAAAPPQPAATEAAADRPESLTDLQLRKDTAARTADSAEKSASQAAPRGGTVAGKKLAAGEAPKGEAAKESLERKDRLDRNKELPASPKSANDSPVRMRAARSGGEKDNTEDAAAGRDKAAEKDEKSLHGAKTEQKAEGMRPRSPGRTAGGPGATDAGPFNILGDGEGRSAGSVWVPLLTADENGEAVIEFTMPPEPGDYKLILDVLGPGRATQIERLIRCELPPAAAAPAAPAAKP